jgi:hypothetical protein
MRAVPLEISWHPGLSIYASEQFLKAVGAEYGWLGGTDNSGSLRCILPYTIIKKMKVRMVRFRVETIPLCEDFDVEQERAFLDNAVTYFRSINADIIIPATTNSIFRTYPHGAVAAPYGTYIIDLNQPEAVIWGNIHSKHKNVIRNAMKKNVQILDGLGYADLAYGLVKDTFKRSAISFMAPQDFTRMISGFGEYVKVFVAVYQGNVQGCAVIPFSHHSAYYVYGGSIPETVTGAMNLLQWEAIRFFHNIGVKRYDFCGVRINPERSSKQYGLKMFKERFGPQLHQGYMWKYPIKRLKSSIYSSAVKLLRGGDIVDAERHRLGSHQVKKK